MSTETPVQEIPVEAKVETAAPADWKEGALADFNKSQEPPVEPEAKADPKVEAKAETKEEPKPDAWVDSDLVRLGRENGYTKDEVAGFGSEKAFLKALRQTATKAEAKEEKKAETKDPRAEAYEQRLTEALGDLDEGAAAVLKKCLAAQQEFFEERLAGLTQGIQTKDATQEFTEAADAFFNTETELFGKGTHKDVKGEHFETRKKVYERARDLLNNDMAESYDDAIQQAFYALHGPKLIERAKSSSETDRAKKKAESEAKDAGRKLASAGSRRAAVNAAEDPNISFRDTPELHALFEQLKQESGV